MTKKDFFRVLIKVFGLYSLILALFQFIPTTLSYVQATDNGLFLFTLIFPTALVVSFFLFLLLKTDNVLKWLKLGEGFDDDEIKIGELKPHVLVSILVIVIGGIQIVHYAPNFILSSYQGFKHLVQTRGLENNIFQTYGQVFDLNVYILTILNLVIGILLISNYTKISKWLIDINKKNNS